MKKLLYLVIAAWISSAGAGSYEDFFRAIKQDDAGEIGQLLARGFDPNTPDPKGLHGLFIAMREPSPKVAEVLIDFPKTNVEWQSKDGETALMIAALKGQLPQARKLIARGADVNKTGWTPLHYAATGGHLEMIRLLLDNHAYIDAESPNGSTPLMLAAKYGSREAVKLLLDEGADPRLKNQLGLTAIDFAYQAGRSDVADGIAAQIRGAMPKGSW